MRLMIVLPLFIAFMVVTIRMVRIMIQPMQRVQVKVLEKKGETPKVFATFEMPDGTEKELQLVDPRIYRTLKKDDTGVLIYKELKNSKDHRHRRFSDFEKDPNLDDQNLHATPPLISDEPRTNKVTAILIVIVTPIIIVAGLIALTLTVVVPSIQLTNRPEQSEQVEVIGKRIYQSSDNGKVWSTYIVAFRFPDGSVKELSVGTNSSRINSNRDDHNSIYDSINQGDTGILIYKEIEKIEEKYKNEDLRYDGRQFIGFEKDP